MSTEEAERLEAASCSAWLRRGARAAEAGLGAGGETRLGWGMHPQHLHGGQTGRDSPFIQPTQPIQPTDDPMGQTAAHGTYPSPEGQEPSLVNVRKLVQVTMA